MQDFANRIKKNEYAILENYMFLDPTVPTSPQAHASSVLTKKEESRKTAFIFWFSNFNYCFVSNFFPVAQQWLTTRSPPYWFFFGLLVLGGTFFSTFELMFG